MDTSITIKNLGILHVWGHILCVNALERLSITLKAVLRNL